MMGDLDCDRDKVDLGMSEEIAIVAKRQGYIEGALRSAVVWLLPQTATIS